MKILAKKSSTKMKKKRARIVREVMMRYRRLQNVKQK